MKNHQLGARNYFEFLHSEAFPANLENFRYYATYLTSENIATH